MAAFLEFSKSRGNDLSTPMPEFGFLGLKPGDRWCLCAPRWQEAQRQGFQRPTHRHDAANPFLAQGDNMRVVLPVLLGVQLLAQHAALAAEGTFLVELNTVESVENRCRLNFVIENKSDVAVDSMKLDLVVFGSNGGILRRLLTEMGPVRSLKTIVRAFVIDDECGQIGSILVNEVTACAPGNPNGCLDELALSSRLKELRFHK